MPENYPSFIVDAFTKTRFAGNPAAVCLIPNVLKDEEYLKIAAEFNLSETAFPIPTDGKGFKDASEFSLRWFTPKMEYPLCGHATLATSHVLFNEIGNQNPELKFSTKSGILTVKRGDLGTVEMNFPEYELKSIKYEGAISLQDKLPEASDVPDVVQDLIKCVVPDFKIIDYVFYNPKEKLLFVALKRGNSLSEFLSIKPNFSKMLQLHNGDFVQAVCITVLPVKYINLGYVDSENQPFDYACRFFDPWTNVDEDPATGSAQCALAPFWSKITKRTEFYALQAYPGRGAQFRLKVEGDRVIIKGHSVTVMDGNIRLGQEST